MGEQLVGHSVYSLWEGKPEGIVSPDRPFSVFSSSVVSPISSVGK